MRTLFLFALVTFQLSFSQTKINYGTPNESTKLPEKLTSLKRKIRVNHFPKVNNPVKIKDRYYWKHATGIFTEETDITIIEYGAYLFYNGKWNLRKTYNIKELDKTFKTKNQKLLQGQPYVWSNNWRTDSRLFGGWAMWYFIGQTSEGKLICGYETIHTTDNLLK